MKYSQQEIIQYVQEEDVKSVSYLTVSPLTRPPSMDLVMRLIQIYFFIQNRIL